MVWKPRNLKLEAGGHNTATAKKQRVMTSWLVLLSSLSPLTQHPMLGVRAPAVGGTSHLND